MTIKELKAKRAELAAKCKSLYDNSLKENRDLSESERTEFDAAEKEIETYSRRIETSETVARQQADLDKSVRRTSPEQPDTYTTNDRIESGEPEWFKDANKGFRSLGHICDDLRAEAVGNQPSKEYARWKQALNSPELQAKHFAAGTGGQIAAINSEGGTLLPAAQVGALLEKPMRDNPILNGLQTIPISSGNTIEIPYINETSRATGSRAGGIRVYRDAELDALTQSKAAFGKLSLKATAMTGMAFVSNDLLKFSAVSVEALITRLFQREFTFKLQDEVINGVGANEMVGILGANCVVSQAKETGQAAATIVVNNIIKMWARRHVASGPYVWAVNQDCMPQLMTMTLNAGTAGTPVGLLQSGSLTGTPTMSMLGAPVVEVEQCATAGTVGDIILMAPGEFVYAPVPGIDSDVSIHLKFDYRQSAFRFVIFNTGAPWWNSTLTPYKGSATQSPFVVLATRA